MEGGAWQFQSSDALPAPTACDTKPVAKIRTGSPVAGKDAERVGELCFESQHDGKISVATIALAWTRRRRCVYSGQQGDQEENGYGYGWKSK